MWLEHAAPPDQAPPDQAPPDRTTHHHVPVGGTTLDHLHPGQKTHWKRTFGTTFPERLSSLYDHIKDFTPEISSFALNVTVTSGL